MLLSAGECQSAELTDVSRRLEVAAIRHSPGLTHQARMRVGSDEASAAATSGVLPRRSTAANGKHFN